MERDQDVTQERAPAARRRRRPRIAAALTVLVLVAVLAVVGVALFADDAPGAPVARSEPLLPDLAMAPIEDIAVGVTESGEQRLRFAATIVNVGEGPLLVRAERSLLGGSWTVDQWIAERSGGYSLLRTPADLIFGGDGHDHWHVEQVEVHQLETLDGTILGRLVKQGFCFFDTDAYEPSLAAAPERAHWGAKGCNPLLGTRVRMGLSVGWGDKYPWHLLDERIDVTGLADGTYRIRQIADPNGEFEELDETNNETWVDVELTTTGDGLRETTILEAGPPP